MSNPLLNPPEYGQGPSVNDKLEAKIDALDSRLGALENLYPQIKRDAVIALVNLLGKSLKLVASGELDIEFEPSNVGQPAAPQFDPRWDAWKQKLGSGTAPARVIDSLLTHGPLTRTQLRAAGELGWSTLDAAISRLKNLALIEKVGDRWQLKQS